MYYRSASAEFRKRFGCKVYKLALSGGMSCPNRDGTKGERGCTFCLSGSGDFAEPLCDSVEAQLARAKRRVAFKASGAKYIAYFQSYTNTYAPAAYLRKLFSAAIAPAQIVALSVATRPDCLPDEVISLLRELNAVKPVTVELGLQTIHPQTAARIRRGYELSEYDSAVRRLKVAGIEVITHVILGLPGETAEMIEQTVRYVGKSGADGIKLQLLHILDGTDLADEWRAGKVPVLELSEYLELLGRCVEALPPQTVIHRLTGDGAKKSLLAPLWSADKKAVLAAVNRYFETHDITQGRTCDKETDHVF